MASRGKQGREARFEVWTAEARRDVKAFERRILRFVAWGRRTVVFTVGVCLALAGLAVHAAVVDRSLWAALGAAVVLGAAWSTFRLFSRGEWPPEGVQPTREQALALLELIDAVTAELGVAPFDVVVINDGLALATVRALRKWGLWGPWRRALVIGLPRLHAVPADEFRVALARACARVAPRPGRRTAQAWVALEGAQRLAESAQAAGGWVAPVWAPALRAFAVRVDDMVRVYRRALALDGTLHRLVAAPPETAARLDVRLEVIARRPGGVSTQALERLVAEYVEPPVGLTRAMNQDAVLPLTDVDRRYLAAGLAAVTPFDAYVPSLSDQLASLGIEPATAELPPTTTVSAATALLGEFEAPVVAALDLDARRAAAAYWSGPRAKMLKLREELRILEHDARFSPLDAASRRRRAELILRFEPERATFAYAELEATLGAVREEEPQALKALGVHWLRAGDDRGVALLERAVTLAPNLAEEAYGEIGTFHAAAGRAMEARVALEKAREAYERSAEPGDERRALRDDTPVEAHGLPDEDAGELARLLSRIDHVTEAWLARKVLPAGDGGKPVYVLIVRDDLDGRVFFSARPRAELYEEVRRRVQLEGHVLVVPLGPAFYGLWRRTLGPERAHVFLRDGVSTYR